MPECVVVVVEVGQLTRHRVDIASQSLDIRPSTVVRKTHPSEEMVEGSVLHHDDDDRSNLIKDTHWPPPEHPKVVLSIRCKAGSAESSPQTSRSSRGARRIQVPLVLTAGSVLCPGPGWASTAIVCPGRTVQFRPRCATKRGRSQGFCRCVMTTAESYSSFSNTTDAMTS